jgi:hypothetical protein
MAGKKSGGNKRKPGGANASRKPSVSRKPSASRKPQPKKTGQNRGLWVVGALLVGSIVAAAVFAGGGAKPAPPVSSEEAKYLGRFLPGGYSEPKVTEAAAYSSTWKMSSVTPASGGGGISIPVAEVASKKIVSFKYSKPGGEAIPLVAYAKPSGKLFLGVSYCVPCKGEGQRIESDGTLTCESCGTKRDLETMAGLSGACKLYPLDELPTKISGGRIVVEQGALDSWTPQPLDRKVG